MTQVVRLLRLRGFPILQQLWLEESLMRAHTDNWFVINDGAEQPAIVLGVSGKPHELVHVPAATAANIPLIKRFTGGGTVVVDHDTILTSLIMHEEAPSGIPAFPRPIMEWTEGLYASALRELGNFKLRENDYVFDHRKFGGNAQAISRNRWLHHTSMLWDYLPERMDLLKNPSKAPEYRQGRDHSEFVITLKEVIGEGNREQLVDALCDSIKAAGYTVVEGSLEEANEALDRNKLIGTRLLSPDEYAV